MISTQDVRFGPSGSASRFPIGGTTPTGRSLTEVVNRNLTKPSTAWASKAAGPTIKRSMHFVLPKTTPDSIPKKLQKSAN